MNEAPPLLPIPKKKFTLSAPVLIIWLAFLGLTIYLAVARNLDARAMGELTGGFIGRTLIALLLSWVAWRLSRRSDWVKNAVFLIVFLVFSADHLAGSASRRRQTPPAALQNLQEQVRLAQEAQVKEFNETGTLTVNTQAMNQIISSLKDDTSSRTPDERKLMAGMADFLQKLNDADEKNNRVTEQMDAAWVLQPQTPKSPQEMDALATSITNFLQSNKTYWALLTNSALILTDDLRAKGLPAYQISQAVHGFQSGYKPQLPYIEKIREQDNQYGETLLQIVALLKSEHGKWTWDKDAEAIAFDHQTSAQRWDDLVARINQIAEDQQQTQAELIEVRSKTLSRQ
jgi:hypothetical protein